MVLFFCKWAWFGFAFQNLSRNHTAAARIVVVLFVVSVCKTGFKFNDLAVTPASHARLLYVAMNGFFLCKYIYTFFIVVIDTQISQSLLSVFNKKKIIIANLLPCISLFFLSRLTMIMCDSRFLGSFVDCLASDYASLFDQVMVILQNT